MGNESFSITQTLRGDLGIARLPFLDIKNDVLGRRYELSLAFVGTTLSRRLNKVHRGKDYPTNVLSFSLESNLGEIVIDYRLAEREARRSGVTLRDYLLYLFIHGLHHLKGLSHGSTMEKQEEKIRRKYNISVSPSSSS